MADRAPVGLTPRSSYGSVIEPEGGSKSVGSQPSGRSRPRRVMLFGLFGWGNVGNDATLFATLEAVRRRFGDVEILCACSGLPPSAAAFDVKLLPLDPLTPKGIWRIPIRSLRYAYAAVAYLVTEPWRRRRMLRLLAEVDELIVVGTGVLDDFGMLPWDAPAWLLRWTHYARTRDIRVTFLAVGAGPIRNRLNRVLMLQAVRQAHVRSYRDLVSKNFLSRLGIDTAADPVVPDLVFGVAPRSLPPDRSKALEVHTIGVGVMGYYGWRNDPSLGQQIYHRYVSKVAEFVCWLLNEGYRVRLLIGEIPADLQAIEDITLAVGRLRLDVHSRLIKARIESLEDLFNAIAECEAVVASRYHNVICSLILGRPVIALGYASKFDALMTDVGLGDYCRNIEEFEVAELKKLFADMLDDRRRLSTSIAAATARYRKEVDALYDSTFGARTREVDKDKVANTRRTTE